MAVGALFLDAHFSSIIGVLAPTPVGGYDFLKPPCFFPPGRLNRLTEIPKSVNIDPVVLAFNRRQFIICTAAVTAAGLTLGLASGQGLWSGCHPARSLPRRGNGDAGGMGI